MYPCRVIAPSYFKVLKERYRKTTEETILKARLNSSDMPDAENNSPIPLVFLSKGDINQVSARFYDILMCF